MKTPGHAASHGTLGRTGGNATRGWRAQLDKRLLYAVLASAAVHLSAVTLFNVVIYFQVSEITYYDFHFVQAPRGSVGDETALAVSTPLLWDWLPKLTPPSLESPPQGRLTLSNPDLTEDSLVDEIYGREKQQLSALGAAAENIRDSLRQLTLEADRLRLGGTGPENVQNFNPASGVSGTLSWPQRDKPRELLFAPPLHAVWDLEPALLARGIELSLSVNSAGQVTRVFNQNLDLGSIMSALEDEIRQYRFTAGPSDSPFDETATLVLRRAVSEP